MKTGLSLIELATRIEANKTLKQDYIADTRASNMVVQSDGRAVALEIPTPASATPSSHPLDRPVVSLPIRPLAHDQIAAHIDVPRKYYQRMLTKRPDLLARNVNTWMHAPTKPNKRMVRTLGGDVRGFLSNRYNRIENEEIAEQVLPILLNTPGINVVSAEITERRMYIQATTTRITGEVKKGDVVQAGVVISNSEVGHGAVSISPLIFRLVCLNGMISADGKLRANHVGGRIEETEALYADDTRQADDRAILLKVRDHVRGALDEALFGKRVQKMAELAGAEITGSIEAVVEVLSKKVGATEGEKDGILKALIKGGDLSAWGLINAVTYQAHGVADYDRGVEFEKAGGDLLNLPTSAWREVLQAA